MVDETFFQQCHLSVDAANKMKAILFLQGTKTECYISDKKRSQIVLL